MEGVSDDQGGHLSLVWQDGKTRWTVLFPYSTSLPVRLEIEDAQGSARNTTTQDKDRAEREARLKAGKPLTRLPRHLEWDQITLGSSKDDVLKAISVDGRTVLRQDAADAVVFTFGTKAAKTATVVPRQLVARWNKSGRVVEIRARYEVGPAGTGFKDMIAGLQKKAGTAAESPGSWAGLWKGLPERKPAATLSTWTDDVTVMTFQSAATEAEIALRDWSADQVTPLPLVALEFLPHGPEGCSLGDRRDDLLRRWKVTQPEMVHDALVLRPAAGGRFDALLIYFDGDVVNRIVARQALPAKQAPTQPAQMVTALMEAWGHDSASFGWPSRQDVDEQKHLTGLGWHDDRTQIWLSWQPANQGPLRIFTEWKAIR